MCRKTQPTGGLACPFFAFSAEWLGKTGKVEIPHEEIVLTEEEKAALAEQERRRAKKAEYNRRYMEKKRRQWREQWEREQEQKPHKLPPVADEKGEKSA